MLVHWSSEGGSRVSEGMPYIEARRRGRIRETRAHDRVTFDLETGELFGSLGRSGAGKTTTLEVLSAILGVTPDAAPRGASRRRPSRGGR